jgi:hypothetical protein
MDRETRCELDRLCRSYEAVLREIRWAVTDDKELACWHKLQTLGWELNALLPTTSHRV